MAQLAEIITPAIPHPDELVARAAALRPLLRERASDTEKPADTGMTDRLIEERSGILRWMLTGCLDWQRHGLTLPEKVKAATGDYRQAEDVIAAWIEECCIAGQGYRARAADLYDSFKTWSERAGETPVKQKTFGDAMTERGFRREKSSTVWYVGLALQQNDGPDDGTMG